MKHFPFCRILLFTAAFPVLTVSADETSEIKFSDPSKPGTLEVSNARGNIRIRGTDAAVVTINSEAKPVSPAPRKDGLRVLTASTGFNLTEKGNVIRLDAGADGFFQSADFEFTIPRTTSVVISSLWGGDISCADVTGDIEIKNMNGKIKLDGIAGSVLVETMNGGITANVRELRSGKPLSFTSTNGEIVIRVPSDAKANVRFRSQNGAILTDFDEKVLVTKTESVARSRGKRLSGPKMNSNPDSRDWDLNDVHVEVHDAVKAGVDAAREALAVVREGADAAREAMREAAESDMKRSPTPPRPALPPMTGGKIVTGTLNEGGSEIQASTMNGDVTLRKLGGKM